jgi:hypothetical protein
MNYLDAKAAAAAKHDPTVAANMDRFWAELKRLEALPVRSSGAGEEAVATITSAELREIERAARAKARAAAEQAKAAIRRGDWSGLDPDGGYRIQINVTLCPWDDHGGAANEFGLEVQGSRDIRPTLANLRRMAAVDGDYQPARVSLCTYWEITHSDGEAADDEHPLQRTHNVTVWKRDQ